MSRTSNKKKRLDLFEQGNDRCPICLTSFTRGDVEQGEVVTLEHVRPKSVNEGLFSSASRGVEGHFLSEPPQGSPLAVQVEIGFEVCWGGVRLNGGEGAPPQVGESLRYHE